MNAKIRITICLILSLCLLLLPACKGGQISDSTEPSEQKVGQTDATDHLSQTQMTEATQQSQETEGPQQTENTTEATEPAKTLDLNWKAKVVKASVLFDMASVKPYEDSMYSGSMVECIHLDYEGYEKLKVDYAARIANQTNPVNRLEEVPYSKEFFEENSLILINVLYSSGSYFEIKNLSYTGGVVACEVEFYSYVRPAGSASLPSSTDYLFFLEVDADLPEITNITTKHSVVRMPQEEYDQKIKELKERFGS